MCTNAKHMTSQANLNVSFLRQMRQKYSVKVVQPEKYFDKVLIANRGEIACRVMQTCKRLGIKTVAVYTDADANSKHVRMADEAVYIGSNVVSESYTNMEKILEAMKNTGAQAVHPGYGFLSENSEFANAVREAGLTFIGPNSEAINAMGDKIESKLIAKEAGVHIIPGYDGEVSLEQAVEAAKDIGYPVMIKASAGGGGKGMRVAYNEEELIEGYKLSQSEAKRNFANDKMLIEKFIEEPRHVEIQVLSDTLGNHIYLNERECSVQRRNQKVVEEAPAVVLDVELRKRMGEQACMLARAVNYVGAGTVEMMVDKNKNFYFLEMNTRLQVEHPITEMITRVDIVEQMLRAASGKPLSFTQDDIGIHGWATECRVYAEDPHRNFAPSIGQLTSYIEPTSTDGSVRVDSGIVERSEISVFFDPMISKLVTWGNTRDESIDRMIEALDTYVIHGVQNNVELLRDILTKETYRRGDLTTDFLKHEYPHGFKGVQLSETQYNQLAAAAALVEFSFLNQRYSDADKMSSEEFTIAVGRHETEDEKKELRVRINQDGETFHVTMLDSNTTVSINSDWTTADKILRAQIGDEKVILQVRKRRGVDMILQFLGAEFSLEVYNSREAQYKHYMPYFPPPDLSKMIIAPMPGSIISVNVQPGDEVKAGQVMLVMEAMKMQNSLKAAVSGVVKEVKVKEGDIVNHEQVMIELN